MWVQETKIPKESLDNRDFILIKYNCALCSSENEVCFQGFYLGYFANRPNHVWDIEVECPACEGSNSQIIEIKFSNDYLHIDIKSQEWAEHELKVNPKTIFYSLDEVDISDYAMEIPFELDVLESIIGND